MAENCTHNCDTCGVEGCGSRIQKFKVNDKSHIKKAYAVVSGKGGVGKSFVTSLLACQKARDGKNVAILDGDIVGPSIPKSFNVFGPLYGDGKDHIIPCESHGGIKIVSTNLMVKNETDPLIFRGSMIINYFKSFYEDTLWGDVDYLFIDMPPGTGDVTLTVFQSVPLDGVIIVTSPQELVSMIVSKAINMANIMNIPILGIVENMSYVECPNCKEKIKIYGESNVEGICEEIGVPFLGRIPLKVGVSEKVDNGDIESIVLDEVKEISDKI